jgi:putative ABC transport system permease protein
MPWKLLWRNVLGHPVRSLLTIGAVTVAVFLITVLQAVTAGLSRTLDASSANRLLVQSAVSLYVDLPLSYQQKMASVDGIEAICKWQWFGGRYEQDKGGFFAQFGIDADTFMVSYPEMSIAEGSYEDFSATRTACIVGKQLAEKYDWRVGQTVPISGTIFTRTDNRPWDFTIKAIYESSSPAFDQQQMFFHYEYLHESLEQGGAVGPEGVGVYMLRLSQGTDPLVVQGAVDGMFENGPQRVQTTTEAEFNRQFITMLGDIPSLLRLVGGAVLFAIFFAVLNTMMLTGRERTRDIGVMRALGFTNRVTASLLIGESLLLCAIGAAVAITMGLMFEGVIASSTAAILPGFAFDRSTLVLAGAIALGVGFVSGLLPGVRTSRMTTTQALQELA